MIDKWEKHFDLGRYFFLLLLYDSRTRTTKSIKQLGIQIILSFDSYTFDIKPTLLLNLACLIWNVKVNSWPLK